MVAGGAASHRATGYPGGGRGRARVPRMGPVGMAGHTLITDSRPGYRARLAALSSAAWERGYLRWAAANDFACALLASTLAAEVMKHSEGYLPASYFVLTAVLPALWLASVGLAGGYDSRFIGVGSDEFRRMLNAAV